jgi:uncharacterized protein (DUF58 family)
VKRELARLNHVLIPQTRTERERYRNGRAGRPLRLFVWLFTRMTREGRFSFAMATLGVAFSLDVGRTEAHLLVFSIGSLLFASLLLTPAYRLKDVTAHVRTPRRVTIGEEIAVTLTVRNDGDRARRTVRVERPRLPWDGTWAGEPPTLGEVPPRASLDTVMRAKFIARGEHDLDPTRLAALVPLWLAQGPPIRSEGARFVVVPKVARVQSVTMRMNRRNQPGGVPSASRTGETTDLLGVRPYRAGDPVRDLHARSWARHGEPMVREYQEEHLSRVAVIVDIDVRAGGAGGDDRLEAALSLVAGVVARVTRTDAVVDLLVVGDEPQELSSEHGPGALDQALDLLAAVQNGPAFSAERTFACLAPYLERLSAVVFVALAWDPARAGLAASIQTRGVDCPVLVVGARDAREPHARMVAVDAITRGEALAL